MFYSRAYRVWVSRVPSLGFRVQGMIYLNIDVKGHSKFVLYGCPEAWYDSHYRSGFQLKYPERCPTYLRSKRFSVVMPTALCSVFLFHG